MVSEDSEDSEDLNVTYLGKNKKKLQNNFVEVPKLSLQTSESSDINLHIWHLVRVNM